MAANYFGDPSQNLKLVGITGTNGKTTIASLLYQLFKKAGFKVGLLSTVKILVDEIEYKATHTTPDSITINHYLNEMVENGVEYCFMEVSSHGIHQKRTEALHFVGGIFTNLSHDHLDYHPTFAEYRDVKKSFFDNLPKTALNNFYGADVAGPVFKRIAQKIFTDAPSTNEIKNLNRKIPKQENNYDSFYVKSQNKQKTIPNVKGMSGMDAVALLGNLGIKVKAVGVGKVKKQSLQAGQNIQKNTTILLELS